MDRLTSTGMTAMEPEKVIRAGFLLMTSTFVFLNSIPALADRLIIYGSRASKSTSGDATKTDRDADSSKGLVDKVLDAAGAAQVSHAWFTHFYIVSVVMSIFWAVQFATDGGMLQEILSIGSSSKTGGMTLDQIFLVWTMMAIQGSRRLYETVRFTKPTQSTMPVGHYVLGLGYYVGVSMAIWVEGIPTLRQTRFSRDLLSLSAPSLRTLLCVPLFLVASGTQYDFHKYLASLKKYTLPTHPIFRILISPHYAAECLVYVSLMFAAAPQGAMINKTVLCILVFVVANLGITAETSRLWYEKKFGADAIKGRSRMIPYIY